MFRSSLSSFFIVTLLAYRSNSTSAFHLVPIRHVTLTTTNTKSFSYVHGIGHPSSLSSLSASSAGNSNEKQVLDTSAISKYFIAGGIELSLFSATFYALDRILTSTDIYPASPIIWLLFYVTSFKSRVFNPLDNSRPDRRKGNEDDEDAGAGFQDRIMPKWTPPGITFPIVWLLIIGPLRATSSVMIVHSTGLFFSFPIMSLILHLTIGDIWNSINNIEKRYGTSVVGVGLVYISAIHAVYRFFQVDEQAGTLLGVTLVWLTIASSLIIQTWRLNLDNNGEKDSLFPTVNENGESLTKFSWFNN